MKSKAAIFPMWNLARSIFMAQRHGFFALGVAVLACGWGFHSIPPSWQRGEIGDLLAFMPMGLSLFLTFIFCNITGGDPRNRFDGFPRRLFTLPLSTPKLVLTPMLFSVTAIGLVYLAWAGLALPAMGRPLPLGWPLLYLSCGMSCFQTVIWALAGFKIARMVVLGMGGTLLALGWIVLRKGVDQMLLTAVLPVDFPARGIAFGLLAVMNVAALLVSFYAVENQRRGVVIGIPNLRGSILWERCTWPFRRIADRQRVRSVYLHNRFKSCVDAQFWYEWRRHGRLLPATTVCVLFLIVAPAPFAAPIGAERAGILLSWIVALPLLLAFVLGKGFGKADLWSRQAGIPLYLATRPLNSADWIQAKIKSATFATVLTWSLVLMVTPLWLWLWCDYESMLVEFRKTSAVSPTLNIGTVLSILLICIFLTWRFLVGSLYVGLLGRAWINNVTACALFLCIFAFPLGASVLIERQSGLLLYPPRWVTGIIVAAFCLKIIGAAVFSGTACRRGLINPRSIFQYGIIWCVVAILLLTAGFKLLPAETTRAAGWSRWTIALAILMFVPVLRVAAAPLALARNRSR